MPTFQYIPVYAENGKLKFVFLGRQTKNGNQRLLFQQKCPSMCIRYMYIYVYVYLNVHVCMYVYA